MDSVTSGQVERLKAHLRGYFEPRVPHYALDGDTGAGARRQIGDDLRAVLADHARLDGAYDTRAADLAAENRMMLRRAVAMHTAVDWPEHWERTREENGRVKAELDLVDKALNDAGIEYPPGHRGVKDLVNQRDGQADRARGAEADRDYLRKQAVAWKGAAGRGGERFKEERDALRAEVESLRGFAHDHGHDECAARQRGSRERGDAWKAKAQRRGAERDRLKAQCDESDAMLHDLDSQIWDGPAAFFHRGPVLDLLRRRACGAVAPTDVQVAAPEPGVVCLRYRGHAGTHRNGPAAWTGADPGPEADDA